MSLSSTLSLFFSLSVDPSSLVEHEISQIGVDLLSSELNLILSTRVSRLEIGVEIESVSSAAEHGSLLVTTG